MHILSDIWSCQSSYYSINGASPFLSMTAATSMGQAGKRSWRWRGEHLPLPLLHLLLLEDPTMCSYGKSKPWRGQVKRVKTTQPGTSSFVPFCDKNLTKGKICRMDWRSHSGGHHTIPYSVHNGVVLVAGVL